MKRTESIKSLLRRIGPTEIPFEIDSYPLPEPRAAQRVTRYVKPTALAQRDLEAQLAEASAR